LWKIRAFVTVHTCVPVTGIFQKAAKESGVVKPEYGGYRRKEKGKEVGK